MEERVMLVDDDPAIQRVVATILLREGYDLCIAGSGRECIAEVRDGFRGLVLMDIMMPGLDGWETIEILVDEGLINQVRICLFSVLHDTVSGKSGLERYVIGRLAKPFTYDELLTSVREIFALSGRLQ